MAFSYIWARLNLLTKSESSPSAGRLSEDFFFFCYYWCTYRLFLSVSIIWSILPLVCSFMTLQSLLMRISKSNSITKYTGEWNKYGSPKISAADFNKNSQALENTAVYWIFNLLWKCAKFFALTAGYKLWKVKIRLMYPHMLFTLQKSDNLKLRSLFENNSKLKR